MEKKFVVVGLGEMLWDHIGEEYKLGGAPANFAYHAMQLGGESHVVSAVGDDHLGKKLTADLSQTNMILDTQVVDFPTGVVEVTLADGQPSYEIKLDAAWDNMQFTPALEELAKRTDLVCFGTLAQRNSVSRDTIQKFLDNGGRGIHHIAFKVEDGVGQAIAQCEAAGLRTIDKAPRCGADSLKIAFLHPKSTQGVLTELCEE